MNISRNIEHLGISLRWLHLLCRFICVLQRWLQIKQAFLDRASLQACAWPPWNGWSPLLPGLFHVDVLGLGRFIKTWRLLPVSSADGIFMSGNAMSCLYLTPKESQRSLCSAGLRRRKNGLRSVLRLRLWNLTPRSIIGSNRRFQRIKLLFLHFVLVLLHLE